MAKTALLAGATGLVGSQVVPLLLASDVYAKVIVVSRQPLNLQHDKLLVIQTDFDRLDEVGDQLLADDVYCCLGTTIRKVKTQEAFRKVDYQYPIKIAEWSLRNGAQQYLLISALGADSSSSIFYNRVKGEVERDLSKMGFRTLHILQPSLLLGPRTESRSGEDAAKWVYRYLGFLIPTRYKGIDSQKVARAMLALSKREVPGIHIHASSELQQY